MRRRRADRGVLQRGRRARRKSAAHHHVLGHRAGQRLQRRVSGGNLRNSQPSVLPSVAHDECSKHQSGQRRHVLGAQHAHRQQRRRRLRRAGLPTDRDERVAGGGQQGGSHAHQRQPLGRGEYHPLERRRVEHVAGHELRGVAHRGRRREPEQRPAYVSIRLDDAGVADDRRESPADKQCQRLSLCRVDQQPSRHGLRRSGESAGQDPVDSDESAVCLPIPIPPTAAR